MRQTKYLYRIWYRDVIVYVGRTKQPLQDCIHGRLFRKLTQRAVVMRGTNEYGCVFHDIGEYPQVSGQKYLFGMVSQYAVICIEDLNLDGMKRLWGRKVSDLAFAEFVSILEWLAQLGYPA